MYRLALSFFVVLGLGSTGLCQGQGGGGNTVGGGGNTVGGGGTTIGGGATGGNRGGVGATGGSNNAGGRSENLGAAALGQRNIVNQNTGFLNQGNQQTGFLGQQTNNRAGGGQFGNVGNFRGGQQAQGRGQQQGRGNQSRRQTSSRLIRTRITLGTDFGFRIVPATRMRSNLETQFRRIDQTQSKSRVEFGQSRALKGAKISVVANGRKVILRGQVASDRDRDLAERIAKLEPGVDEVSNELTVVSPL